MSDQALDASIVALVSLASGIASKHPDMGLCQLEKLRHLDVSESDIATVIEIARHIRDEAAQKLDIAFDEKSGANNMLAETNSTNSCCSTTASGQSCC